MQWFFYSLLALFISLVTEKASGQRPNTGQNSQGGVFSRNLSSYADAHHIELRNGTRVPVMPLRISSCGVVRCSFILPVNMCEVNSSVSRDLMYPPDRKSVV